MISSNNQTSQSQPPVWQQPGSPPLYPPPLTMPPMSGPQLPEPQDTLPPAEDAPKPSRKKLWIVAGVMVLVIAAIGAAYMLITGQDESTAVGNINGRSDIRPLDSLEGVTLIPPADLSRYLANGDNTPTRMLYTTSDKSCELRMGVANKDTLPGKDFNAIVAAQIKALRDNGAAIDGPRELSPLYLADAVDGNRAYSLPTVSFTASRKGEYISSRYSAAILKNDVRVYVVRECKSKDALAKPEQLDTIDKDAAAAAVVAAS